MIVIDGDVGVGKSNLAMWMLQIWMELLYNKCLAEHIRNMGLTKESFLSALSKAKPMELVVYDEAGDLNNRRTMAKFNVKLMIAYKVIRADNIFTILVIDDIFDLDPYFRKKRVKALFHVKQRGRVEVWLKNRLRAMLAMNQGAQMKNIYAVAPDFRDTYKAYDGVMKKEYDKLKAEKTTEARRELGKDADEDKEIKRISDKVRLKQLRSQIEQLEQETGEFEDYD